MMSKVLPEIWVKGYCQSGPSRPVIMASQLLTGKEAISRKMEPNMVKGRVAITPFFSALMAVVAAKRPIHSSSLERTVSKVLMSIPPKSFLHNQRAFV